MQVSKSTLSDAINKYEELGLMCKHECENDKRNLYVSLSDEGIKILKELAAIDDLIKAQLFVGFDKEDSQLIETNVRRIADNLK